VSVAIRRPLSRRWRMGRDGSPWVELPPGPRMTLGPSAAVVPLGGPAGPAGPTANGRSYNGMDPSDPTTYVRPYNPQPGMIGRLNFDGAMPNRTQTV
jgi:hypothetical protein